MWFHRWRCCFLALLYSACVAPYRAAVCVFPLSHQGVVTCCSRHASLCHRFVYNLLAMHVRHLSIWHNGEVKVFLQSWIKMCTVLVLLPWWLTWKKCYILPLLIIENLWARITTPHRGVNHFGPDWSSPTRVILSVICQTETFSSPT